MNIWELDGFNHEKWWFNIENGRLTLKKLDSTMKKWDLTDFTMQKWFDSFASKVLI